MRMTFARQNPIDTRRLRQIGIVFLLGFPVLLGSAGLTHAKSGDESLVVGKMAPSFLMVDVDGKKRSLTDFRGRPIAIFFFCGCTWCAQCAHEWADLQRRGGLASAKNIELSAAPATLLIFSGDAASARSFAGAAGLDTKQTVTLPDLTMRVTLEEYQAEPCPRVFVIDANGIIRYTNNHPQDAPRKASALAITAYALDALRRAGAVPIAPSVPSLVKRP